MQRADPKECVLGQKRKLRTESVSEIGFWNRKSESLLFDSCRCRYEDNDGVLF